MRHEMLAPDLIHGPPQKNGAESCRAHARMYAHYTHRELALAVFESVCTSVFLSPEIMLCVARSVLVRLGRRGFPTCFWKGEHVCFLFQAQVPAACLVYCASAPLERHH